MKYDKLVRDKIPKLIHKNGKTAYTRILHGSEFQQYLEKKLDEEVAEFHESGSFEELADILEVLYALAKVKGLNRFSLEKMRRKKRRERGGFNNQVCLIIVTENGSQCPLPQEVK